MSTTYLNGTQVVNCSSYVFTGSVGIGTTNPQTALHIYNGGNPYLQVSNGTGACTVAVASGTGAFALNAIQNDVVIRNDNATSKLHFLTGSGNAVMTVTNASVGIGIINPQATLDVNGSIKAGNAAFRVYNFSGTLASSTNTTNVVTVPTGINTYNILSVSAVAGNKNNGYWFWLYPPNYDNNDGANCWTWYMQNNGGGAVNLFTKTGPSATSANILGGNVSFTIICSS